MIASYSFFGLPFSFVMVKIFALHLVRASSMITVILMASSMNKMLPTTAPATAPLLTLGPLGLKLGLEVGLLEGLLSLVVALGLLGLKLGLEVGLLEGLLSLVVAATSFSSQNCPV